MSSNTIETEYYRPSLDEVAASSSWLDDDGKEVPADEGTINIVTHRTSSKPIVVCGFYVGHSRPAQAPYACEVMLDSHSDTAHVNLAYHLALTKCILWNKKRAEDN